MEAKDTVMNYEEAKRVAFRLLNVGHQKPAWDIEKLVKKQAEISFKAGREAAFKEVAHSLTFACVISKAMKEIASSHVFFIIQQAYKRDMEWEEVTTILNAIISEQDHLPGEEPSR